MHSSGTHLQFALIRLCSIYICNMQVKLSLDTSYDNNNLCSSSILRDHLLKDVPIFCTTGGYNLMLPGTKVILSYRAASSFVGRLPQLHVAGGHKV